MTNFGRYFGRSIFYSGATIVSTGTVVQVFLAHAGVGESAIGVHTAMMSFVNVMASIVLSGAASSPKGSPRQYIQRIVRLYPLAAVCLAMMAALCLMPGLAAGAVFAVMLLSGMLLSFFTAFITVLEHRLPYLIIARGEYDRLSSVNGLITGVTCTLMSLALSAALDRFAYDPVMFAAFLLGALFMCFAGWFVHEYRVQADAFTGQAAGFRGEHLAMDAVRNLTNSRSFRALLLPNFLRGCATGILNMAAVVALNMGYDSALTGAMVTVSFLASMVGSLLYFWVSGHLRRGNLALIAVGAALMGAMLLMRPDAPALFLAGYALAVVGRMMVDYGVPSRIYELIDGDMACVYHTWRMIITTLGVTLSSAFAGAFIERCPAVWLFLLAVVCQGLSSAAYCLYRERQSGLLP